MHSNNSHTNGLANFQTQNLSLKTNQSSILPTTIHHPMSRFDFDYKNCALEDKSNQLHDPHKKSTQQNINKKLNKNLERQFLQNASLTENPLKVFSKKQPPKEEKKPKEPKETEGKDNGGVERKRKVKIKLRDGKEREIQHMMSTSYWSADGKPITADEFLNNLFEN